MTKEKVFKYFKDILPYLIIIAAVILIRTFIATPVRVNGDSMDDTLKNGEILILNKLSDINRFDIVVINLKGEKLIKRVIGMPNETIKIDNNTIYVNNEELKENYGKGRTFDNPEIILGENEYFVLGDNREESKDSRFFGAINKDDIQGTTNFILFPFKNFGTIK